MTKKVVRARGSMSRRGGGGGGKRRGRKANRIKEDEKRRKIKLRETEMARIV